VLACQLVRYCQVGARDHAAGGSIEWSETFLFPRLTRRHFLTAFGEALLKIVSARCIIVRSALPVMSATALVIDRCCTSFDHALSDCASAQSAFAFTGATTAVFPYGRSNRTRWQN